MLQEFGQPVDRKIEESLQYLRSKGIIPNQPHNISRLTELALRFASQIQSAKFCDHDLIKLATLFGSPVTEDYRGPTIQQIVRSVGYGIKMSEHINSNLQGFILFGSRLDPKKRPRNTKDNPSDIDAVAVFDDNWGDLITRGQLTHLEVIIKREMVRHQPVFMDIPFKIEMAERASSIIDRLTPERFNRCPYWAACPTGVVYVGRLRHKTKKESLQLEASQLIVRAISSPDFQDLRRRHVRKLFGY